MLHTGYTWHAYMQKITTSNYAMPDSELVSKQADLRTANAASRPDLESCSSRLPVNSPRFYTSRNHQGQINFLLSAAAAQPGDHWSREAAWGRLTLEERGRVLQRNFNVALSAPRCLPKKNNYYHCVCTGVHESTHTSGFVYVSSPVSVFTCLQWT